ncbi:TonB-dependent siderophore receptor [Neisseria sp. ZJ106]|uniref:TonB-dependent siderophore receptor n=1 Tax=Neisseria lisongii TaxID=2912188 RepID=A0ABY7RJW3_9NEIS|nr:TonB-dependent siderophore receptor [Neisseria lisongii]MCF7521385.1 TonB-dependent siderophore receptor [Neisseria lisongii]WCL71910.1 TonB-dependent siderophore receptor [Neisseria lisongii]
MKKTILAVLISNVFIAPVWADTAAKNNVDLQEVTVKGDRQGVKVQTNVVTLQEKDESTATDLRGLLKDEPAIDFGGGNGTSQFLTIRGMGQNSVDVKIDNAYSDSQILYHQGRFIVDPSLVKVVSVQKGAGSASAGIGATNGAVIAKTVDALDLLKGSDKDWGVKLNGGYASNDGRTYGAAVFGKAGYFDGLFAMNRNDEHDYQAGKGFDNGSGSKTVLYSGLDKRNYLAKVGATFDNHRIVLSRLQNQNRGVRTVREEFRVIPGHKKRDYSNQLPAYREVTLENNNLEYIGKNLGFIDELTANAYVMKNTRYSANDDGIGYAGFSPKTGEVIPTNTVMATKGANINFDSSIGDHTVLKYGANYRHQDVRPDRFLNPNVKNNPEKTDSGVYVEAINELGDFTLTGGLRYDHFHIKTHDGKSESNHNINPSLGVIWQPLPTFSLSASHNYASRSPRLYDALQSHGKRGIISVADGIKAERARNTEIGFNYNDGMFAVNGSYFWQTIKDAVVNPQDRHGTYKLSEAVNSGTIKNHGYELGASYRNGGLTAKLGVAHSKPRFYDVLVKADANNPNPEFAAQVGRTWTASLAYRFDKPNLEIGWQNRTVEKTDGSTLVIKGKLIPAGERASYNVNDIFANWKPLGKDTLNVNFSVNNIFNKYYHPHSQRLATDTLPGVGRDVRLAVNYKF